MTKVYFITNNHILNKELVYQKEIPEEKKKELTPLNFKGERIASELLNNEDLLKTQYIYSSNYISTIETAKYLAEKLDLKIYVDERLKERRVGILGMNNEKFLKETQEHDFEYHLHNGESLQNVLDRMKDILKDILFHHENKTIAIFTHDIALEALLSTWCEKGFNLENHLILSYKEEVIIDGAFHPYRIFALEFDGMKLLSIKWINKNE